MYYTSKEVYEYISQQTNDPIVERKICAVSGESFAIYQSDLEFYAKISPTLAGQKFTIPTPTLCPEERQRRRLSFRNERKLYKRKCDFSGKDIISIYSPNKAYIVYDQEVWRSDNYDPLIYGRDFDSSMTFTEQYESLLSEVPKPAIQNTRSENCGYTNYSSENKNCYLAVGTLGSEDCYYAYRLFYSQDTIDCYDLYECKGCYECIESTKLYNCYSCQQCHNSSHLQYCENCSDCEYCIDCINLHSKKYHINNKAFSKEEYYKELEKNILPQPEKQYHYLKGLHSINSNHSSGGQLIDCEKCNQCFSLKYSENCAYFSIGENNTYCYDCNFTDKCELQHNVTNSQMNYGIISGNLVWSCKNCHYLTTCFNSNNCFGCVGLKNHEYCIFNKQYTKEDYEITVAKIIAHMQETGEWGEFFHPSLSPFGYNETVAQEYFPLTKNDALGKGYKRSDYSSDTVIPPGAEVIDRKTNPDISSLTDEKILSNIYLCEITNRPYRIISQELAFYHKHHLPLPRRHPDQRHADRMALRAPRELHLRTCDNCDQQMISVYEKFNDNKVYCEKCYQKEIYA